MGVFDTCARLEGFWRACDSPMSQRARLAHQEGTVPRGRRGRHHVARVHGTAQQAPARRHWVGPCSRHACLLQALLLCNLPPLGCQRSHALSSHPPFRLAPLSPSTCFPHQWPLGTTSLGSRAAGVARPCVALERTAMGVALHAPALPVASATPPVSPTAAAAGNVAMVRYVLTKRHLLRASPALWATSVSVEWRYPAPLAPTTRPRGHPTAANARRAPPVLLIRTQGHRPWWTVRRARTGRGLTRGQWLAGRAF